MPQMNATLEEVVIGIDWAKLRKQKRTLCRIREEARVDCLLEYYNDLSGAIHLIEAIQDAAVAECVATEKEVFNLPEGS